MRVVKLLVTLLMLTMNVYSAGVRGRDRVNGRRHRYRHNPYEFVPATETVAVDYEEVEVSSYCRESVAHHESYVRAMTQATTASSKVPYYSVLMSLFFSDKRATECATAFGLDYLFKESSKVHVTPLTCCSVNTTNHILNNKTEH